MSRVKSCIAALDSSAPYLWAALTALTCDMFISIKWWHPYCDSQADGPGYFASGFPFPYAELTGASSMDFVYMPQVWAINLVIFAVIAFAIYRMTFRSSHSRPTIIARGASLVAAVLILLMSGLTAMYVRDLGHAVRSIGASDSYWSYRPNAFAAAHGHKECEL